MVSSTAFQVSNQEIRDEVERIMSSPDFRASKRLKDFLRYIVEETMSERAATIKAYTIAVIVFGRSDSFDSQVDPIVSVEAGRLRKALEHYYLTGGKTNPLKIEIARGTYVPNFVRQESTHSGARSAGSTLSKQNALDKSRSLSSSGPGVAVVVFESLSAADQDDYFATGLSAQLVANLSQFEGFFIVGPLFRQRFENPRIDLIDLGKRYDVQFVLSGSVRRKGDCIRLIANLIDVESAANVWVKQFDRDLSVSDLYEVEDEITREVAATLADRIGIITRILVKRMRNKACQELTSFDAALKMYHWGIVLTEDAFNDAWRSLQHAVEREPDFALTKALPADIYASDYLSEIGLLRDRMATAEALAREAVDLDPDCPDARWVMGFVHFLRRRPEHFLGEFEAALTLNPHNAMVLAIFGLFLPGLGQWEKAMQLIASAKRLNPHLSSQYHIPPCLDHYRRGEYQRALEASLLIRTPGLMWEPLMQAAVLGQLGRTDEAQPCLQKLLELQPNFREQGRKLIRRLFYSDETVDMVYEGLQKAGFPRDGRDKLEAL